MSESEIPKQKAVCKNCGYEWTPRNPNGKHRFKCSKCGAENVELVNAPNPQAEPQQETEQTEKAPETKPETKPKTPEITKPTSEEIAALINEPPREKPRETKRGRDTAANQEDEEPQTGTLIPNIHPIMAVFLLMGVFAVGAIIYFRASRKRPTKKSRRNNEKQQREETAQPIHTNPQPRKGIVGL